ncbi:hypothetical protein FBEOM_1171 [Fusarium beomiforme]|uniref:Uncharacterized protein n=1 Tax=Fusarium beomiforme TaxID=44412 RepID=A0A9P5ATX6_9HYPO|nr:hypothetical protein FBEOM_1171 [Fusarium beomiforme]
MDIQVYVGSSFDKRGGWHRLKTHEIEANKPTGIPCEHYEFIPWKHKAAHDYRTYLAVSKSWKAKFGQKETMAQALNTFFPGLVPLHPNSHPQKLYSSAPQVETTVLQPVLDSLGPVTMLIMDNQSTQEESRPLADNQSPLQLSSTSGVLTGPRLKS